MSERQDEWGDFLARMAKHIQLLARNDPGDPEIGRLVMQVDLAQCPHLTFRPDDELSDIRRCQRRAGHAGEHQLVVSGGNALHTILSSLCWRCGATLPESQRAWYGAQCESVVCKERRQRERILSLIT